jgi:hypothetical protein
MEVIRPRIVVTMTTLPGREDLITRACASIMNQTLKPDAIYLALPKISRRLKCPYPPMPALIGDNCIIVEPETDYGPITKLYGALVSESDPETIIISCDDDIIYPPPMFEILVEKSMLQPEACICGSGLLVKHGMTFNSTYTNMDKFHQLNGMAGFLPPATGRKVDIICGAAGALYKRKFFGSMDQCIRELFEISISDMDILCNDDILISGYLQTHNVERIVFPSIPFVRLIEAEGAHPEVALSFDGIETVNRMSRALQKLVDRGFFTTNKYENAVTTFEQVAIDETMAAQIIFASIIGILMLILVIVMWITLDRPVTPDQFRSVFYL